MTVKKILLPGYLFLVAEHAPELKHELHRVIGLTKLLTVGEEIIPLTEEEVAFLKRMGGEEQVVVMSEGIIENSVVHVTEGPLMGMEGMIRRIDRHKRKAYLEVKMFGRTQQIEVGLEIIRKS